MDLHNPNTADCKRPTSCDVAFQDVSGSIVDITGYSFEEAKSEDSEACIKIKMHKHSKVKLEGEGCTSSKNYICEFACSRK